MPKNISLDDPFAPTPGRGWRPLGQELWREMAATLHGIIEEQEESARDENKLSFVGWVNAYHPRYQWYEFNLRVAELLQAVADGIIKRLMIFLPPRHGKSELVSRLFSAYFLYLYPHKWVGVCSYGASLAETLSRNARANFLAGGGEMRHDSKSVSHWETSGGGGLWAAGVGGGILGKGFSLGIIDDPVKDAMEAASTTTQSVHQEWWQSTFYTRRDPEAAIVIVMQRWHELDLAGWLLKSEYDRRIPECWHVIAWEALKEPETPPETSEVDPLGLGPLGDNVDPSKVQRVANYIWPSTVSIEPDWRQPGEALCPERYDAEDLLGIKDGLSSYYWSALYQQRPRPREGLLFKVEHFKSIHTAQLPRMRIMVRAWDYGATEDTGDYTAGIKIGIGTDGNVYIMHGVRGQWSSGKRDKIIKTHVQADGKMTLQGREQEPGSSGKDTAVIFRNAFPGYRTFTWRPTGSKFERADPLVSAGENGKIFIVIGPWMQWIIDELVAFGSGSSHDDVADATSAAYNEALARIRMMGSQTMGASGSSSQKTY